ncbi:MAG: hypothetical protein ACTHJL_03250 [Amnibacterium sp.]
MRVSEIMGTRARAALRCVGVEYAPDERHRVMSTAVELYRVLGVEVEVDDLRITLPCSEVFAATLVGPLERLAGRPAFNEWRSGRLV